MSNRLKTIYTYLIENRKHERFGWYNDYKNIISNVQTIRENLNSFSLEDIEAYKGTSFANIENPKWHFFKAFFANKGNGVASNGRSILSNNDFDALITNAEFVSCIENLIKDPSLHNHNELKRLWKEKIGNNNPVLTNRATAACSLNLTSTVDEASFTQVFNWLQEQNLIIAYVDQPNDWYSQNIFVMDQLKEALKDVRHADDYWISIFYWEMYENLANPFSLKKQIIKYGAPGTGKTYIAKETAKLQFDIWKAEYSTNGLTYEDVHKLVQFHPSYSYEDFIEGLRPVLDSSSQAQLQLVNGIFKTMCIAAGKWEVDIAPLMTLGKLNDKKWEQLTINDVLPFEDALLQPYWEYVFKVSNKNVKLIDVIPPYFIIIDEINRAELSRVFGELMYCLEYRGVNGAIETQYNQLNSSHTGMIKLGENYKFFVPHNIYIIGTMNTVDRSVESFDFALRRRFRWQEVEPSIAVLKYHLQTKNPSWVGLADNLRSLNESILNEPLLGKDFCVGHAYLMDLGYATKTTITGVRKLVWEDSILPLLEEYVRGTGREREIIETFTKSFGV